MNDDDDGPVLTELLIGFFLGMATGLLLSWLAVGAPW